VAALTGSNFLAHVLAVMFLFLAINEYEGEYRPWLIGGPIGLAMRAARQPGSIFYFLILATSLGVGTTGKRVTGLIKLLLPFTAIVALLAVDAFAD
jgi:hypothetical protein